MLDCWCWATYCIASLGNHLVQKCFCTAAAELQLLMHHAPP